MRLSNLNCPVGAVKLKPVPGVAVVVGFATVVVAPNPNVGNAVLVVAPNVTFVAAGFANGAKPNVVVVVAGCVAAGVNVGSVGCVTVAVDSPKLPKAGG